MKIHAKKILLTCLTLASAAALALGIAACTPPDGPDPGPDPKPKPDDHVCETKCPECGLCLDPECTEDACAEKCGDALTYNYIFDSTSLRVAKTNATVNPGGGCIEDFNKEKKSSIVYRLNASAEATVTLTVYVSTTTEENVFTDVIEVKVNNGEKLDRPAKIPTSLSGAWAQVYLGCIKLQKGSNEISFVAQGDGTKAHNFQKIELFGDLDSIELEQASGLWHECQSKCETCGKCINFSCYNTGCADKCECESGAPAHIFWVCDERVKTSRAVNAELDGIGASWGQVTTMVYTIKAAEDMTVKFGAVISTDAKERLFTDQFPVTVNGVRVTGATGKCPQGEKRSYNDYHLVLVGEMKLKKGINTVRVDQDLSGRSNANWGTAYNFQSLILFTDKDVGWAESEHTLEEVPEVAATCKTPGTKAHWVCTDAECGKMFLDPYGSEEVQQSGLTVPASESKHTFTVSDGKVTCSVCQKQLTELFDPLDDKVTFVDKDGKTKVKDKNNEKHVGFSNGSDKTDTLTFYIQSNKQTTADLWTNVSAIASGEVVYTSSWTVKVNGTEITSETIHHVYDASRGAKNRYFDHLYEYVASITLNEGVNTIEFISTGVNALNFERLAFLNTAEGTTLTLVSKPAEDAKAPEAAILNRHDD